MTSNAGAIKPLRFELDAISDEETKTNMNLVVYDASEWSGVGGLWPANTAKECNHFFMLSFNE